MIHGITHFCGAGNISTPEMPYGIFTNVDKCCEGHDGCKIFIKAKSTDFGIENKSKYIMSDCKCDKEFFDCLDKVNNIAATGIKYGYALVIGTCISKEHEPKCTQPMYNRCKKYQFNTTSEIKYRELDTFSYMSTLWG